MLSVMLALAVGAHHGESYTAQLVTFIISILPAALLLALIGFTIVWRIRRNRKSKRHPDMVRELLHK